MHGSRREAESELAKLIAQVSSEGMPGAPATTVGNLIERWWEHALPDLSPNTARGYRQKIDYYLLPALGEIPLRKLSTQGLDEFYGQLRARGGRDGRPLAVNTVRRVHAIVRRACEQAIRWGWLTRNPAALASIPRGQASPPELPEPAELLGLLRVVGERNPDLAEIAHLAVLTGARRAELCGLRWADLDLDAGILSIVRSIADTPALQVRVPKTRQSQRTVALDPATVEMLRARKVRSTKRALACGAKLKPTGYVFSEEADGRGPLAPMLLTRRWQRMAEVAGVKCRFHDLRHFTASQLIAAGVAVTTVSERLGHASTKMTVDVYGHPVSGPDRQAAEILSRILAGHPGPVIDQPASAPGRRRRRSGNVSRAN